MFNNGRPRRRYKHLEHHSALHLGSLFICFAFALLLSIRFYSNLPLFLVLFAISASPWIDGLPWKERGRLLIVAVSATRDDGKIKRNEMERNETEQSWLEKIKL